jgi:protein-S-isoprenylcysteine O-methyltransferase Ste14
VLPGPYRFVRHPFYCSYLLTWAEFRLLPTVTIMLIIYTRAAKLEEEKFTRSSLAETYKSCRTRTGLFLPNPIKMLSLRRLVAR